MRYTDEQLQKAVKNSFMWTEVVRKLKGSLKSGNSLTHAKKRAIKTGIDFSHFKRPTDIAANNNRLSADEILVYNRLKGRREGIVRLRRALKAKGVEEKCEECGITDKWNGKNIVLEIHHENNDCVDNRIENLKYLCPNCHSQK